MQKVLLILISVITLLLVNSCAPNDANASDKSDDEKSKSNLPIDRINLPEGFKIEVFAENVNNARSLAQGEKNTIFVGNRTGNKVYAITYNAETYKFEKKYTIASGLKMPNGVAFKDGDLYVAEVHRILKYEDIEQNLGKEVEPKIIKDDFPKDTWHGWKFIRFGPDGYLYVPVGAPCNVCERDDPYATITRIKPDGTGYEVYARGIRNTVGFDWHPETKELWFTENGRDMMGDDKPADELNKAAKKGLHFGFPYFHATGVADDKFKPKDEDFECEKPELDLGPHVAALGMRFYTGSMFPKEYKNQIFIAEHGSWNRTKKIGYRITMAQFKVDGTLEYKTFADGWMKDEKAWGRPVDVEILPDGSMLVSDDYANCIYRITYTKPESDK